MNNPSTPDGWLLCHYINTSPQIQRVQIANFPGRSFERLLFPMERLLFDAPAEAELEVQPQQRNPTEIIRIPCGQLAQTALISG